jgi:hypothetical protein
MRVIVAVWALFAYVFSSANGAWADEKAYGVGFATVGQSVKDVQDVAKTDGRRLFCDADKDPEIGNGDREVMRVTDAQAAAGLTRCAIFGKEENGSWTMRRIGVAGQPSEFWILALDDAGTRKIMQIQVFQPKEAWDSTSKALTQEFGQPTHVNSSVSNWHNANSELAMTRGKEGFYVFYSDIRLQQTMRERLGLVTK